MFFLRDIPKYDCIRALAARYPEVDPSAVFASLVLVRAAGEVTGSLESHLAGVGLSQGRLTVLMLLLRSRCEHEAGGPVTPSDLADKAGVTRATMTGLIDGLEREGLVRREEHPGDRRMTFVRLTEAGEGKLSAVLPGYYGVVASLMSGLAEGEREALVGLLRRIGGGRELGGAGGAGENGVSP